MMALLVVVVISTMAAYIVLSFRKIIKQTSASEYNQRITDFKSQHKNYQVVYEATEDSNLL